MSAWFARTFTAVMLPLRVADVHRPRYLAKF
jgi:hypothetical protein